MKESLFFEAPPPVCLTAVKVVGKEEEEDPRCVGRPTPLLCGQIKHCCVDEEEEEEVLRA